MKKHTKVKRTLKSTAGPCAVQARELFWMYRGSVHYTEAAKSLLVTVAKEGARLKPESLAQVLGHAALERERKQTLRRSMLRRQGRRAR